MRPLDPALIGARVANSADLAAVTETIGLAFADDPVWGPIFSRAERRTDQLALWRLWLEGALRYRWVWLTEAAAAVSVWIPPGGSELSEEQDAAFNRLVRQALGPVGAADLAEVVARFAGAHPRVERHYYLSLLGTHPAHRGRGIGMALLTDNLARIDEEGAAAYLESSNPANDHRYQRLGFVPYGRFVLPNNGPVVTTMWRAGLGATKSP